MPPIVISAMNRKGGAGKSTLLRAMISALIWNKKTVLAIDTDPTRALMSWHERAVEKKNSSPLLTVTETIDVGELGAMIDGAFETESADFVLIDTPGAGGSWADAIAAQSDLIVTPVILARTDLQKSLETFFWYQRLSDRTPNPELLPPLVSVITRYSAKTTKGKESLSKTQQELLDEVAPIIKPIPYAMRERPVYQDMDNEGLLGARANELRDDENPLVRSQAGRYLTALNEAVTITNALLGRLKTQTDPIADGGEN